MGFELKEMSFEDWRQMILVSSDPQLKRIQKLLEGMILDEEFFLEQTTYKRDNTDRLLVENGTNYPAIDKSTLTSWLRLLCQRQVITTPRLCKGESLERSMGTKTVYQLPPWWRHGEFPFGKFPPPYKHMPDHLHIVYTAT